MVINFGANGDHIYDGGAVGYLVLTKSGQFDLVRRGAAMNHSSQWKAMWRELIRLAPYAKRP